MIFNCCKRITKLAHIYLSADCIINWVMYLSADFEHKNQPIMQRSIEDEVTDHETCKMDL